MQIIMCEENAHIDYLVQSSSEFIIDQLTQMHIVIVILT